MGLDWEGPLAPHPAQSVAQFRLIFQSLPSFFPTGSGLSLTLPLLIEIQ